MTSWKRYVLAAMIVTAAGLVYVANTQRSVSSDLRDAVAEEEGPAYNQLKSAGSDASVVYDGNTNKTPGPLVADAVYGDSAAKSGDKEVSSKTDSKISINGSSVPVVTEPAKKGKKDTTALQIGVAALAAVVVGALVGPTAPAWLAALAFAFCATAMIFVLYKIITSKGVPPPYK